MLSEEILVQKIFSKILDSFGKNHARIYWALINQVSKTASQLEKETSLGNNTVYPILNELAGTGLVGHTQTTPKLYYCRPSLEAFESLVKEYKESLQKQVQEARAELKKLVNNATSQSGEEYLIRVTGGQTTLYNNKTKETIEWKHEIQQIKQVLDKIPTKNKEKAWQVAMKE